MKNLKKIETIEKKYETIVNEYINNANKEQLRTLAYNYLMFSFVYTDKEYLKMIK